MKKFLLSLALLTAIQQTRSLSREALIAAGGTFALTALIMEHRKPDLSIFDENLQVKLNNRSEYDQSQQAIKQRREALGIYTQQDLEEWDNKKKERLEKACQDRDAYEMRVQQGKELTWNKVFLSTTLALVTAQIIVNRCNNVAWYSL